MKAQKTSLFQDFYTTAISAMFVSILLPASQAFAFGGVRPMQIQPVGNSGYGNSQIIRGNSDRTPEAQIIRGLEIVGSHGDPDNADCDNDLRQQILDEYLTEVDIIGPTDDREEINSTERPYAAAIGYENQNGEWITFGNGWQTKHPRLLILPAHMMVHNGAWQISSDSETPSADQLGVYQARIAGCPGETEPYRFERIASVGSLSPVGPADDYVVVLLDRDTCLGESQLARTLNLEDSFRAEMLFAENAPLQGRLDSFMDRSLIGNTVADASGSQATNGVEWVFEDGALHTSVGPIGGQNYYREQNGQIILADESSWGQPGVKRYFRYYGDADQGNSGGAVSAIGTVVVNGNEARVDHVIGMQISEHGSVDVEQNNLLIYEGQFEADVEAAAELARQLDRSTGI